MCWIRHKLTPWSTVARADVPQSATRRRILKSAWRRLRSLSLSRRRVFSCPTLQPHAGPARALALAAVGQPGMGTLTDTTTDAFAAREHAVSAAPLRRDTCSATSHASASDRAEFAPSARRSRSSLAAANADRSAAPLARALATRPAPTCARATVSTITTAMTATMTGLAEPLSETARRPPRMRQLPASARAGITARNARRRSARRRATAPCDPQRTR